MMTPITATLPATVQFVGPWTDADRAQVVTTLTPLIPALTVPWVLTYEHDATATTRTLAVIPQAYSAAVERDGEAQRVLSRRWDLGMFLRQLAAHIRTQAEGHPAPAATPIRRSPLEVGQWLTKQKFEKRYQPQRWRNVVVIDGGAIRVRVQPYALQTLIRQHKDAYFQFVWNNQPHTRQQKIAVTGRRSAECMGLSHQHCPGVRTSCPFVVAGATLAPNPNSGSETFYVKGACWYTFLY